MTNEHELNQHDHGPVRVVTQTEFRQRDDHTEPYRIDSCEARQVGDHPSVAATLNRFSYPDDPTRNAFTTVTVHAWQGSDAVVTQVRVSTDDSGSKETVAFNVDQTYRDTGERVTVTVHLPIDALTRLTQEFNRTLGEWL